MAGEAIEGGCVCVCVCVWGGGLRLMMGVGRCGGYAGGGG
jgi:hypothetical protein